MGTLRLLKGAARVVECTAATRAHREMVLELFSFDNPELSEEKLLKRRLPFGTSGLSVWSTH